MTGRLLSLCERNFWLFFVLGLGLGLLFPWQFTRIGPATLPLLALVLFLTYLKLDIGAFFSLGSRAYHLFYLWLLRFLLLPMLGMLALTALAPQHVLGLALMLAIPPAMSSPVLAEVVGGKVETTLFLAVLGHLLSPLSLPLLVGMLGNTMSVSLPGMARLLALLVLLPFGVAMACRRAVPRVISRTSPYYSAASLSLILVVLAATVAPHADVLLAGVRGSVWLLIAESALLLFLYCYSWLISSGMPREERLAVMISGTYLNLTLLVVLTAQFFSAREVLTAVLFVLPVNLALVPLNLVARRLNSTARRA